jgi:hypothetical protein
MRPDGSISEKANKKGGSKMIVRRTKKFLLISVTSLAVGAFGISSFGADMSEKGTGSQKSDAQPDKDRLIESRKEQQQKKTELREAVKSGASKEEIKQRQKQIKEGQKAIVQDKKEIRQDRLDSLKDQGTKSSKDAK